MLSNWLFTADYTLNSTLPRVVIANYLSGTHLLSARSSSFVLCMTRDQAYRIQPWKKGSFDYSAWVPGTTRICDINHRIPISWDYGTVAVPLAPGTGEIPRGQCLCPIQFVWTNDDPEVKQVCLMTRNINQSQCLTLRSVLVQGSGLIDLRNCSTRMTPDTAHLQAATINLRVHSFSQVVPCPEAFADGVPSATWRSIFIPKRVALWRVAHYSIRLTVVLIQKVKCHINFPDLLGDIHSYPNSCF